MVRSHGDRLRQTTSKRGTAPMRTAPTFAAVIGQVTLLDLVFSIDSVITAVGMTSYVPAG